MRVAIISTGGYLDKRIVRLLSQHGINGDVVNRINRQTLRQYDALIASDKLDIPNLPVVLERIILEQTTQVVYITNSTAIGHLHSVYGDIRFHIVNETTMDVELPLALTLIGKFDRALRTLVKERDQAQDQLETMRLTNRAKRVLIDRGYSEEAAHQFIQKEAMDRRLSKRQIVNLIIEEKIDF